KSLALRHFQRDPDYIPDIQDRNVTGFLAQEVETIYPKAVTKSNEYGFSDFRSLDVDQLQKMHYGATKKLIMDKEALEATVADQASRISTLEAQLNALLTQLNITL
ncbi:MAG: hypothetical protein ACK559_15830, partial [bacterium]